MENNILCCNVGRRGRLMLDFKASLKNSGKIVATDNWSVAPALFLADKQYVVPPISSPDYINNVLDICMKENIRAVTTFIDPEIEILSANRDVFLSNGILPLCPSIHSASLCFDKFEMFKYLKRHGLRTVLTYDSVASFKDGYANGEITFPVFIKPRTGSGSVGIHKVNNLEELESYITEGTYNYIIQEFMYGGDCDADVYVDCISHKVVAAFSKRKLETRIGGASKTISFKDDKLFEFIKEIVSVFEFYGPLDMDFFYKDGQYYLSEINPRFGGAYLHAYGSGVDFVKLIINNMNGIENKESIGDYEDGILMLMYDDVVITKECDLLRDYHD